MNELQEYTASIPDSNPNKAELIRQWKIENKWGQQEVEEVIETPVEGQVLGVLSPPKIKSYFPELDGVKIKRLLFDFINFQNRYSSLLLFPQDVHFTPSGNHLAAILAYNSILENRLFSEFKFKSKINWLSPEVSDLIQRSNYSIKKEIDAIGYSFYLKGMKEINRGRLAEAEKSLSKYLGIDGNAQATYLLCYVYFANNQYEKSKE